MNLEKFDGVTLAKSQVAAIITDSLNKAMEKALCQRKKSVSLLWKSHRTLKTATIPPTLLW